ncbi:MULTISPECIES: serine/threonine protein kinase [unclassified Coleofasciculus]|uniref:serine/threonine protein kinase n=1 Tax=unclassified Coleofasciculus TaxID=2692782 RepID=UPI001881B23E|nr:MULTISPECIES: serine/threonine-protein kinase [unclassified Coleofasciculus]MBE9127346.1 serine/threonine protein kinase [Coleofasciculus sp. LEGE 07081]MBE9150894.1 serine/threonine protein kinase [Coleofasciculus sp. LEGE 07092]
MAWTVGQTLQNGKYLIEKELGRERFGITYLARDEQGNEFVIKTLHEDKLKQLTPAEQDSLKSKFVDEARKLEGCKYPHIVKIHKTFIEGQLYCLAMEYIHGDSLANLVSRVFSEKEALGYIEQIGDALIKIHGKGLLHRNIKPANIRVRTNQSEAVLIDFDLAGEFDYPFIYRWQNEPFAPIELNSQKILTGACTDVYSLAATLYVLLTGKLPASALKRTEGKADLIPPKVINPHISKRVNHAIIKGMELDPTHRPQTMQEWLNLLGLRRSFAIALPKQPRWAVAVEILGVVGILAAVVSTNINVLGFLERHILPPSEKVMPFEENR